MPQHMPCSTCPTGHRSLGATGSRRAIGATCDPALRLALRRLALRTVALLGHHGSMVRVVFTPQLRRFVETPEVDTKSAVLREALEAAFVVNPRLRGYVLDDQAHVRANVVIFIDGVRCDDRRRLDQALRPDSTVHVLQALSGG